MNLLTLLWLLILIHLYLQAMLLVSAVGLTAVIAPPALAYRFLAHHPRRRPDLLRPRPRERGWWTRSG